MASFGRLPPPEGAGLAEDNTGALVSIKFCNLGFVTSQKWSSAYVTILDGVVRLYESEEACRDNPEGNSFSEIVLESGFRASTIKKKDYSKNPLQIIYFYCFYIEQDQGVFSALRKLKIGCTDQKVAKQLAKAVNIQARGFG